MTPELLTEIREWLWLIIVPLTIMVRDIQKRVGDINGRINRVEEWRDNHEKQGDKQYKEQQQNHRDNLREFSMIRTQLQQITPSRKRGE